MFLKRVWLLLALLPVALIFQNCCKAYCGVNQFNLRFINYAVADIDTVLFTKYAANGMFNQKIDSSYLFVAANQADTIYSGFTNKVTYDNDWKIKIISTNREYYLTGITTSREKCTCGNTNYDVFSGHTLNGTAFSGSYIDLKK